MALPKIGTPVHYYDPSIVLKIGLTQGYDGRGIGPYHAVVINDQGATATLYVYFPGAGPREIKDVEYEDDIAALSPGSTPAQALAQKGFWSFPTNLAKARHAKEAKED